MVTKKTAPKSGGDKTTGPVTTSDMNQPAPKADPGAAPAAKTKDGPEAFTVSATGKEARAARDEADEDKNDLRADMRKAEEKAGAVPDPRLVPQGPSALRDWQVSNNPSPEQTQMAVDQAAIKSEVRKEHHR